MESLTIQSSSTSLHQQLTNIEQKLKKQIKKLEIVSQNLDIKSKNSQDNSQNILSIFIKIVSISFKPIQYLLRFMTQSDIYSLAATCRSMYKLIYSPFGYQIIRHLRPNVIYIHKEEPLPTFNKNYLENLCNQVNLVGMDDDDKIAIIMTMKTNLMAAKQKARELQLCNIQWQRKKSLIIKQMSTVGYKRDEQNKYIDEIYEQIQKITQLLAQSQKNIQTLKIQQKNMIEQRVNKQNELQNQKLKLNRQKQLLIKKIKSQQKQREQGLIYARQVARITSLLNKITSK